MVKCKVFALIKVLSYIEYLPKNKDDNIHKSKAIKSDGRKNELKHLYTCQNPRSIISLNKIVAKLLP